MVLVLSKDDFKTLKEDNVRYLYDWAAKDMAWEEPP